jgi:hypothetical protein
MTLREELEALGAWSEKMTTKEARELIEELVFLPEGGLRHMQALIVLQQAAEKNEQPGSKTGPKVTRKEIQAALVAGWVNPLEIELEPIKALFKSVGVEVEEE